MKCFTRVRDFDKKDGIVARHWERGGKLLFVFFDPTKEYIEHLEKHSIPYKMVRDEEGTILFVYVDENYVKYGEIVAIGGTECLLEDEDFEEAVEKYLRGEYEELEV